MDKIFLKEEQVMNMAGELLDSCQFESKKDQEKYRLLYEEYKSLLKEINKVVRMSDLMQMQLKRMSKKLEVVSQIDWLTGLYNRKYFCEAYVREWKSAVRLGGSLALMMIDIDYFKQYNDIYGHIKGDLCLKSVANQFQRAVSRPRDVVVRYGGDEFIILLPETDIEGATILSQKIEEYVNELALEHEGSPIESNVTVSIGIASILPNEETDMEILVNQVDRALYQAKNDGRNCFRVYE